MVQRSPKPATSQYRQVRLTFTQEVGGRCGYSIYAKGLNQAWDEHQCIVRDSVVVASPLRTTEDVVAALLIILEEQFLPSGHTD